MYLFNQALPVFFNSSGMATAGPIPIMSGGHPTTAYPRTTPNTLSPLFAASDLRAISTAAAPSLTWLEFPKQQDITVHMIG